MFAIPSPRTSRRRTLSELSLAGFSAPPASPLAALQLDRNTPRLEPLRFVKRDVPKRSKTLDVHVSKTSRKSGITDENAQLTSPRRTRPARPAHARKRSDGITPQDVFDFRRARASLEDVLPRTLAALPEDPFISEGKVVRCAGRDARDRRVASGDLLASGLGYTPSSSSRIGRPGTSKETLQFTTSDTVARAASSIALRWTPLTDPHSALFRSKWAEWYACSHAPEPETHFRARFAPGFRRMCASVDDAIAKIRRHSISISIAHSHSNSIISQSISSHPHSDANSKLNSNSTSTSNPNSNSHSNSADSRSLSADDAVRLALLREMREELELQRVACLVDPRACGPEDVAEVMALWREGFCVCEEGACEERHY